MSIRFNAYIRHYKRRFELHIQTLFFTVSRNHRISRSRCYVQSCPLLRPSSLLYLSGHSNLKSIFIKINHTIKCMILFCFAFLNSLFSMLITFPNLYVVLYKHASVNLIIPYFARLRQLFTVVVLYWTTSIVLLN